MKTFQVTLSQENGQEVKVVVPAKTKKGAIKVALNKLSTTAKSVEVAAEAGN